MLIKKQYMSKEEFITFENSILYKNILSNFKSTIDLEEALNQNISTLIQFLKEQDYINLINKEPLFKYSPRDDYRSTSPYTDKNVSKHFIKIDLKESGFQSFKYLNNNENKESFLNSSSWEEFILKLFKENEIFDNRLTPLISKSKKIRKDIFNQLYPNSQRTIYKYICQQLYFNIIKPMNLDVNFSTISSGKIFLTEDPNSVELEKIKTRIRNSEFKDYSFDISSFVLSSTEDSFIEKTYETIQYPDNNPLLYLS